MSPDENTSEQIQNKEEKIRREDDNVSNLLANNNEINSTLITIYVNMFMIPVALLAFFE